MLQNTQVEPYCKGNPEVQGKGNAPTKVGVRWSYTMD